MLFGEPIAAKLMAERQAYSSPEHINDSPQTSPSKRILRHIPHYQKTIDGILIAQSIGLNTIRNECNHFNQWIAKLEGLQPLAPH